MRWTSLLAALALAGGCGADSTVAPDPTTAGSVATVPATSPASAVAPSTSVATSTTAAASEGFLDEAAWVADMAVLADGVRRLHPNPFWRMKESDFDAALAEAPRRLAPLGRDDAAAEVMALAADIDGHSGVYPFEAGFGLYALHLYRFSDGIAVANADDPTLIGARVISVGGVPIEDAAASVDRFGARDNDSTPDVVVPMLLMTPEVLHAAGIVTDRVRPGYLVELADGERRTIQPEIISWAEFDRRWGGVPVGLPVRADVRSMARRLEPFWWEVLPGTTVAYLQYNQTIRASAATTLASLVDELAGALQRGEIDRLVVDVRHNSGGDNRTFGPLVELLMSAELSEPGRVAVIIGPQTFSAAANFVAEVDRTTAAVLVGRPTGGRPNVYADVQPVVLPNSGLVVQVSTHYWEFGGPGDIRPAVMPDVAAEMSIADFRAGSDPELNAALEVLGVS